MKSILAGIIRKYLKFFVLHRKLLIANDEFFHKAGTKRISCEMSFLGSAFLDRARACKTTICA
jgi:hypothetical protein